MSQFTVYDAAGEPQYIITCPDAADDLQVAPPGCFLFRGHAGPRDRIDPATGALLVNVKPAVTPYSAPAPDPAWVAARKLAYPSIEQQLDWLWHAMNDGLFPKAEPFYGQIQAVKALYPKTVDQADYGKSIIL